MDEIVSISLANNAALLLVLSIIYEAGYFIPLKFQRLRPVVHGLLIALVCVIIMIMPFTLLPGVVFDTRSILISVSALFFGPLPALFTVVAASITRIIAGGDGTIPGLAVILTSALIGLAWRRWIFPKFKHWRWLGVYSMSLVVHGVMLACMLLIPKGIGPSVISNIAVPVMVVYPIASILLGQLLIRQQKNRDILGRLNQSEDKYRRLFETTNQGVVYQNNDGTIISANPAAERILGMTMDQMQSRTSLDPVWQAVDESGTELPGPDHPTMIALRTGEVVGPVTIGVGNAKTNERVWLSISAIPVFRSGESTPFQVYSSFQDITAERTASQNYQNLFQEMQNAFALHEIICDNNGRPIDYRFLAVNPAFESMTGLKADVILGKTVLEIMPNIEPIWIETYGKVALTGAPIAFEDYSATIGKYFEVNAYQPSPGQFACTFTDVTQRIKSENALKESEKKYSNYIENAPGAIFVADERGRYIEVNRVACEMTGYSREELLKMSIADLTAEESLTEAMALYSEMQKSGRLSAELQYQRKDGSKRWWAVDAVRVSENRYLGFSGDITNRKKAEADLVYLSSHDSLTNLYNRRWFDAELQRLENENELPFSIIVGDINGLKLINDAFGQQAGDELIVTTGNLLLASCRKGDTIARTGGDEFSIILPRTDSAFAYDILKNIYEACIEHNEKVANEAFHVNISLGFGTKDDAESDLKKVIKTALDYMNQRKLLENQSSHSTIIASIKATMIENSHETEEHAGRLVELSRIIGHELELPQKELDNLELFSMLHDIGKIGISDQILNKTTKLSDEEWVELKKHPVIGYRIAMSSSELAPIAEYILYHHERWDGHGYPQNLAGEDIPMLSRILAVVDAYDAMTHDRSYRRSMSQQEAIAEIELNSGTQFDPKIARLFIDFVRPQTAG